MASQGKFVGWEADALLGKDDAFIKSKFEDSSKAQEKGEILCGLLNTARQIPASQQVIKKKFAVSFPSFESFDMPAKPRNFSLSEKAFDSFKSGHNLQELVKPDGESIYTFEEIEEGGIYRVITKFDAKIHRHQVDDEILELEASYSLNEQLRQRLSTVHLHPEL